MPSTKLPPKSNSQAVKSPQRIISLTPSLTEALIAIDPTVGNRIVGVTKFDKEKEVTGAVRVGGYLDPSVEAVAALAPDLVIAEDMPPIRPILQRLRALGINVLALPLQHQKHVTLAMETLGIAMGKEAAGIAAARQLTDRLNTIAAVASAQESTGRSKPVVLAVIGWSPFVAVGKGTFADELIRLAGGKNALDESVVPYPILGPEAVAALHPTLIVDAAHLEDSATKMRFLNAAQKVMKAPLRTVTVSEAILHPGPRLADAAEELLRAFESTFSDELHKSERHDEFSPPP